MKTEKEKVTIVTYQPKLAKAVADMWNKSREGWGGHSEVRTEEQVLSQEENSTNRKTYIALEGEEAIGYCGLSQYREDVGALYIPLLNVRTDYHGKKIGKKLVLTALEETIKEGWPRLDLNTWPGNTKAVPLYKKCGFFWENRDDSVHLMNFLPTVLTAPLLEDFFQMADWYRDSVREIKVEPDGRKQNDFEIYEYCWKKDARFLNVAIEKTSRGICALENEEFTLRMELDQHKLVFGKSYPVRFLVENHTNKAISISIKGEAHRNIQFDFAASTRVSEAKWIEGSFYIDPTHDEQGSRKTHPSVTAVVTVNGKAITLKTGILPMAPVKCRGKLDGMFSPLHVKQTAYVELENNCPSPVKMKFQLPAKENVRFEQLHWEVPLSEKEKYTLSIPYILEQSAFFDEELEIEVQLENGEVITYHQRLSFPFNAIGSKIYGECHEYYHLFSGMTHIALKKENNGLLYERGRLNKSDYWLFYPKLGKPFSEEYSIMKPDNVSFYEDRNKVGMKLTYPSHDFPGAVLHRIIELSGEGLMSQHYVIENTGKTSYADVHLNFQLSFPLANTYLPYGEEVVFSEGTYNHEVGVWEEKKLSEGWLFSNTDGKNAALVWNKEIPIHFLHWHIQFFEEKWETLSPNTSVQSEKVWFGQNVFSTVEEVRAFSLGVNQTVKHSPVSTLTFESKDGSFIGEKEGIVSFKSNVTRGAEVDLAVTVDDTHVKSFIQDHSEEIPEWDVTIPLEEGKTITEVKLQGSLSSQVIDKKALVFQTTGEKIKEEVLEVDGHQSFEVNNGLFTFKAAPSFYPGIYSLGDKEAEWLDSSFPTAKPKSWWNPWVGGMNYGLEKLIERKMIDLPSEAQFVKVTDQFQREWTGIQITTTVTDHETYGGLVYHQYAVTQPGLPVLALFSSIDQGTGFHFYGVVEHIMFNLSPGESLGDLGVLVEGNETNYYRHHQHETNLYQLEGGIFERKGVKNKLHFIPNRQTVDMEVYMNQDVILCATDELHHTKAGDLEVSEPHLFVLSEKTYPLEKFKELQSLRFNTGN